MSEDLIELIIKTSKGDEYRMTVDEAKELRDKLNEMFEVKPSAPQFDVPIQLYRDGSIPNPLMPPYEITCSQ